VVNVEDTVPHMNSDLNVSDYIESDNSSFDLVTAINKFEEQQQKQQEQKTKQDVADLLVAAEVLKEQDDEESEHKKNNAIDSFPMLDIPDLDKKDEKEKQKQVDILCQIIPTTVVDQEFTDPILESNDKKLSNKDGTILLSKAVGVNLIVSSEEQSQKEGDCINLISSEGQSQPEADCINLISSEGQSELPTDPVEVFSSPNDIDDPATREKRKREMTAVFKSPFLQRHVLALKMCTKAEKEFGDYVFSDKEDKKYVIMTHFILLYET
jgi:hypothetical protein